MKQHIFQRKLGVKFITYLGQFQEDWDDLSIRSPEIFGHGWTQQEANFEFVQALDRAIENGVITITKAG